MEYHKSRLERMIVAGLLALMIWAPLPLGSNRDWSEAVLILFVSILAFLWGIHLFRSSETNQKLNRAGLVMLCLLVFT